MKNEFSANGNDFGQDCVWIETEKELSFLVLVGMRFCSVLLFVLGAKFSS